MSLNESIESILEYAKHIRKYATDDPDYVERYYASTEIKKFVEADFMKKNPKELIDEYSEYFKEKRIPTISICKGKEFFRARIGYKSEYGADDDLNEKFILPYYGKEIMTPPPLFSSGARFNKAGTSYLYLADDLETCMAEVHLQVGQLCSIGRFRCQQDIEVINLNPSNTDLEMEVWLDILTQPVYGENRNRYNITNFLSDVIMHINEVGLWFKSVQSKGNNIVCYKPSLFELVPFSERLYRTKEINYVPVSVEDSIDKYAKRNDVHLSTYNEEIEEQREKTLDYMEKWIEFRKNNSSTDK